LLLSRTVVRARLRPHEGSYRPSTYLRVAAVGLTLATIVGGSMLLMAIYDATRVPAYGDVAATGALTEEPLVVAIGRTPGGPGEWITYAGVFSRLQEYIGRPIILRYAPSRADVIPLVKDAEVDMALVSTSSYLSLAEEGLAVLVAAPVIEERVEDAAVLVVAAESDVYDIADLRGRALAVTTDSLAGEPFVRWLLDRLALPGDTFFSPTVHRESPDDCLGLVAGGEASAAAVRRSDIASWPAGSFRVLFTSPGFAMPPLVARADLEPDIVTAVRGSLVSDSMRATIPEDSALDGFRAVSAADYEFVRMLSRASVDYDASSVLEVQP
jgi:ABC-type phosphate/phosphonate transport system substrate-binding protein